MNTEAITKRIIAILQDEIGVKAILTSESALLGSDILDSMEFMNYLTVLEGEYNITIPDTDIEMFKLGKISNMAQYISEKCSSAK